MRGDHTEWAVAVLAAVGIFACGFHLGSRRRPIRRLSKPAAHNGFDHCAIRRETLDLDELVELVKDPGAGAVVTFSGTTRNSFEGKQVALLEYEAYGSMAQKEMLNICREMRVKWPDLLHIAMEHKIGTCPIMDTSVIIAVSSPHRVAALEAVHFAIDTLKATVPVWKKEVYVGKDEEALWKENKEFFDRKKAS